MSSALADGELRGSSPPWPRDAFLAAATSPNAELRPLERLVAVVYAQHAGAEAYAWVTWDRLQACTSLSRDAIARAVKGLTSKGWLVLKEAPRQHHSARYWLLVPERQQYGSQTADADQKSGSRTAEATSSTAPGLLSPSSSTAPAISGPSRVPDYSSTDQGDLSGTAGRPLIATDKQRSVAEAITRKHAALAPLDVLTAVVAIDRAKTPSNLLAYVETFDAASLARWAGITVKPRSAPLPQAGRPRCQHDRPIAADGEGCATCAQIGNVVLQKGRAS